MSCIFCDIVNGKGDCRKFYEDDLIIGIMDKFPFCDGHALLISKTHYEDVFALPSEVLYHISEVAKKFTPIFMEKLDKGSITISYNYGDKQKVKHFHMHILPNIDDEPHTDIDDIYKKIIG